MRLAISLTSGQASYRRLRYCPGFKVAGHVQSKRSFDIPQFAKAKLPCEYACALNHSHSQVVANATVSTADGRSEILPTLPPGGALADQPLTATLFMRIAHRGPSISGGSSIVQMPTKCQPIPNAGLLPTPFFDVLGVSSHVTNAR